MVIKYIILYYRFENIKNQNFNNLIFFTKTYIGVITIGESLCVRRPYTKNLKKDRQI